MDKWILVFDQGGEGCDYTIHCGTVAEEFFADGMAAALAYVRKRREDYGASNIERARLFSITLEAIVPLSEWAEEEREAERKRKSAEKEAAERAEYERLKKRFGEGK